VDSHPAQRPLFLATLVALVAVGWAYWSTLVDIGERWATDPQYSHGFLVPVFAGYLLWIRRGHLQECACRPSWWGVGVVLVGGGLRLASYFFYQPWLDPVSFLVVLAGLAAAAGGRRVLAWAMPAILFLAFVVPLPYRVQLMLGGTLQNIATTASTYVLQTLGVPAVAEGNVILLSDTRLGIVEACNGLSMLVTFFAMTTAVAILVKRSALERAIIVLSAVPIAVVANVVRISLTGVLFEAEQASWARLVFHDLAGWLMMPLALGLLLGELFVLRRSLIPVATGAS
jgi:exosortase